MKKKSRSRSKKNPPAQLIYPAGRGVVIQGMKKPGIRGRFRHVFVKPVEIIGLPNGDVLLRGKK